VVRYREHTALDTSTTSTSYGSRADIKGEALA
jgi:hypothetical protein